MSKSKVALLFVLLLSCTSAIEATDEIQATLTVSSRRVLPFQPARFRLTVLNAGQSEEPKLSHLGAAVSGSLWVKGPGDQKLQQIRHSIENSPSNCTEGWSASPLILQPNAEESISFHIGADWFTDTGRREVRPIFVTPGQYEVSVDIASFDKGDVVARASAIVDVQEPDDDEREVVALLTARRGLSLDLLSTTNRPSESHLEFLQQIQREFSGSSYSPYAQYALARGRLRGNGLSLRRNLQWPLDEESESLARVLTSRLSDDRIRTLLGELRFGGVTYPNERMLVDSLLVKRHELTTDGPVREFIEKCTVAEKDLLDALRLCETAGTSECAYSPAIVATQAHILSATDRKKEATIIRWLNSDSRFCDSLEWLKQQKCVEANTGVED